jgi:hypothetical protein
MVVLGNIFKISKKFENETRKERAANHARRLK